MEVRLVRFVYGWALASLVAVAARSLADRLLSHRRVGTRVPQAWSNKVLEVEPALWRGPAPAGIEAYQGLSAAGVRTVIDLRSEVETHSIHSDASSAGLTVTHIPINNTKAPTQADLERFEAVVAVANSPVYVHCEMGEGRTGAVVGAHQVRRGRARTVVIADALAVGSLTFSQLLFVVFGGAMAPAVGAIDWILDRPTNALFELKLSVHDRSSLKALK